MPWTESHLSSRTLFQFFKEIKEWSWKRYLVQEEATIPWTESHLSVVYSYIINLGNINSEFKPLKKLLPFGEDPLCFSYKMLEYWIRELQEFFVVPELHELYDEDKVKALKKDELLAVFINFLLHLLNHKTDLINSFEDQIDVLKMQLRFLLTILGDTSLLDVELDAVNNLLAKFEDVANEAGSLTFSIIFAMDRAIIAPRMDNAFGALLENINLLKGNITIFSNLLPYIRKADITKKIACVDSLSVVDSLLYDLEDLMDREDDRIADVEGQLRIVHEGLMLFKSLLKDIKVLRYSEIQELKVIVMRIGDVAYEAEYLINSFLAGDNPLWYFTIRLPDVNHKIKLIGAEFQEIKKSFDIGALNDAMDYRAEHSLQAKMNFEVDDITVGVDDKTTYILDQLVGGRENLQIISIFGMPGLGKTTLAKKLYNHPMVNYYFDKCSWSVISQTHQRKEALIGILISLESELEKVQILDMEEESLAERIYKSLKGRRYFIVMDDVWDSTVWDDLRRYFPDDQNGSRILFTSRNKDVAPPNSTIYGLPSLSNDQCWELLHKKVFHNKPCPPQLLRVGRKIAENCHGMPLAVVVVAGILSTMDKEKSTWEKVGGSLRSHIFSNTDNSMIQILGLSYKHLPDHLKPCFLYFGAFPEDTEIPVKKLNHLWIAEGFICKEENKSVESVAEEYLMELIDRSLVMIAKRRSDGRAKACVVHDLLRDLCFRIAEEENFVKSINGTNSINTKHHRLHIYNAESHHMAPCELFLPFGLHIRSLFVSDLGLLSLDFTGMKLLRVLDLSEKGLRLSHGYRIELLVHLRYLNIQYIPASIDRLINLEFLIVNTLFRLVRRYNSISTVIQKMVKLRYLKVTEAKFDEDWNISKTNNLEYLSDVLIWKLKDEEKLKCSPLLRKLKCRCVPFLDERGVYHYPDLRFLAQLESLKMAKFVDFPTQPEPLKTAMFGDHIMTEINFPANIKKLTIERLWLPWEKMSIIGGLPNLQVLKLAFDAFVGKTWKTRDGEFQQLRFLKICALGLAEWNVASREHFPKLQQLVLHYCSSLQEIPSEMGEIATLKLIEIELCPKSVGESALRIQEEQRDFGNEELRVTISLEY